MRPKRDYDKEGIVASYEPYHTPTGNILRDYSSYKNHATISNADLGAMWNIGNYARLPGYDVTIDPAATADTIVAAYASQIDFDTTDPFSIEIVFKTSNTASQMVLIDKSITSTPFTGYLLRIGQAGADTIKFDLVEDVNTNNRITVSTTAVVNDGTWQHVIISYDGSGAAAGVDFFVQGVFDTPSVTSDDLSTPSLSSAPLGIGSRSDSSGALPFDGAIKLVRIYNRKIFAVEAARKYQTLNKEFKRIHNALPFVTTNIVVAPLTGSLTMTGYVPAISATANAVIEPGVATNPLAGYVPVIDLNVNTVAVPVASLSMTGYAPTFAHVDIPLGSLTMAGYAPTPSLTANFVIQPSVGSLTMQGVLPTIVESSAPITLSTLMKMARNKAITDPDRGVIDYYDDDDTTVILSAPLYEDASGNQTYRGPAPGIRGGADRRDRLK